MSDDKKPEIKQDIRDLATALKITIDPKTGLATVADDAYVANMPESITAQNVKDLNNYNTKFVAAAGLALGEASIPVMKKNADLNDTSLVVLDPAKNKFEFTFDRTKMVRGGPGSESTESFGVLSAKVKLRAAKNAGLGHVRTHLSEMATKALAKK